MPINNIKCLLTILGPHAFISTDCYITKPAVPTWNYASVSITGISRIFRSNELEASLDRMLAQFDPQLVNDKQSLPDDFRQKLMGAITGVSIEVTEISGKLKLGHNRSRTDQLSVFK